MQGADAGVSLPMLSLPLRAGTAALLKGVLEPFSKSYMKILMLTV